LAACGCGRSGPPDGEAAAQARPATTPAQTAVQPKPVRKLLAFAPGRGAPQPLAPGQVDAYEIDLEADQYLDASFDQRGVDLVIDVFAPGRRWLFQVDGATGAKGPEPVHLVTETAGRYRLEVSADPKSSPGIYVPELRTPKAPTVRERSQAAADRAFHEARALDGKPESFWEQIAKYERAIRLFQDAGDQWHQGYAFLRLGRLQQSQPREALDSLQRAAELFQALKDPHFEVVTLNVIGDCHKDLAEFEPAAEAYKRAVTLTRETGEEKAQATSLHNLGLLYQVSGQPWQALGLFREALELWKRQEGDSARAPEANTETGIGWAYSSTGDWQRAVDAHRRALLLRNRLHDDRLRSISLTQIAAAWLAVDPHHALPFLEKARGLQQTLQIPAEEAATLTALGVTYRLLDRSDEARTAYGKALDLYLSLHDLQGQAVTRNNLGWAEVALHRPGRALQSFETGLRLARKIRNPMVEAGSLVGMAEAENLQGNLTGAQHHAEESLKIVESVRSGISRPDLQTSYLAAQGGVYGVLIRNLMTQHRKRPDRGFDLQALDRSEQSRARALLDALRESRRQWVDRQTHFDPALLERRQRLLRDLSSQDALRRSNAGSGNGVADQAISQLLDRLSEVESEIRLRRQDNAAPEILPVSVAAERRQLLDADTLLLEYFLGSSGGYVWAVSSDGAQSFELPGLDALEPLLRAAYEELRAGPEAAGGPAGEARLLQLSRVLLGPVASQLRGKRLLIAADGIQQYIPFAAMPDPTGRHDPLILHHEIVSVPSLNVLAELRGRAAERPPAPEALALVADAVFDATDERLTQAGALPSRPAADSEDIFLPRLAYARDEVKTVAALLPPGEPLLALDFEASRDLVTSGRLSRYRTLHFATHAIQRTDQAELSALVLSRFDRQGRPIDGYLRVPDLAGLDLPADLVVLSACDTALGREISGEGLVGLPQAFLTAGARRVLVSLWQVEDESTAALMAEFYRRLLIDHHSAGRALREAQLAIRSQPRWRSPRYWAGFVLIGDWK
jgi:CHAT domain-containing protein/tetratricopeptide (TPR) repeat protein